MHAVTALPLDGILVADFSRVLAGPYSAMTLGDLGAEVIKVERPGVGDDTRAWGPPWADGVATYYLGLNRNKRSVTMALDVPGDAALAFELARRADVLIENFRPGTLDRYGLGYETLKAVNPGLVYCSITGFGSAPQAADLSGYDLLVQAMSGIMSVTGEPDGAPMKAAIAVVDHVTSLQATIGILAALRARDRSGLGQRIEVSLMGAALAALLNQGSGYVNAGAVPRRLGNRHPSVVPYEIFQASDGWFVLACGNDSQFAKVASIVGLAEMATDDRYRTNAARVAHVDELCDQLSAAFANRTSAEWVDALTAAGVPAGPINRIDEAFETAERLGLEPIVDTDVPGGGRQRSVRSPIRMSATPPDVRHHAPGLGEQDAEIRAWLSAPR